MKAVAIPYGLTVPTEAIIPPDPASARLPVESASPTVPAASAADRPRHRPPYPTGYSPDSGVSSSGIPRRQPDHLPKVYRGPGRWLRYWYIPAAALLAAGIAFGIVTVVDLVVAEPDSEVSPAASTTVFSETPMPTPQVTATSEGTPSEGAAEGFRPGQSAVVAGTGDCLNVRSEPSINGAIVTCFPDGTALSIVEGPSAEGDRTWWRVEALGTSGWVAEEYMAPQ